jgi:hypothetical protein
MCTLAQTAKRIRGKYWAERGNAGCRCGRSLLCTRKAVFVYAAEQRTAVGTRMRYCAIECTINSRSVVVLNVYLSRGKVSKQTSAGHRVPSLGSSKRVHQQCLRERGRESWIRLSRIDFPNIGPRCLSRNHDNPNRR